MIKSNSELRGEGSSTHLHFKAPQERGRFGVRWLQIVPLGLIAWLFNHPYVGIDIHDAKLYALLAARWLEPEAYARDPFFIFGSQDDFTVFSPVYGLLIRWFGLDIAAQLIVIAGATLMSIAVTLISEKLFTAHWAKVLAVLLCAAASYAYSPTNFSFRVNEEFATARSIAVPLALFAIAFGIDGRRYISIGVGILATLMHPLMGVWALVVLVSSRLGDRALTMFVASGVAAVAGLALLGVSLLQPLDAAWDSLMRPLSVVYVGVPPQLRLDSILIWLSLLLLAARFGNPKHRRLYQLLALIGASSLLSAQIVSYFWPLKLILQLQLWRSLWLVTFFALFAAVELVVAARESGKRSLIWLALAATTAFLSHELAGYALFIGWIASLNTRIVGWSKAIEEHGFVSDRSLMLLLAALGALALPTYFLDLEELGLALPMTLDLFPASLRGFLFAGGYGLGFGLVAVAVDRLTAWKWLPLALLLPLIAATMIWDQRGAKIQQWESTLLRPQSAGDLGKMIQKGSVVYWHENSPMRTWLELGTASYASGIQPAGSIFSREKTFEMKRRLERVAISSILTTVPQNRTEEEAMLAQVFKGNPTSPTALRNIFTAQAGSIPTGPGIAYLCGDPVLDWVISANRHTGNGLDPVEATDPQSGKRLYLYRCKNA